MHLNDLLNCFQLVPYRLIASAQQIKHYFEEVWQTLLHAIWWRNLFSLSTSRAAWHPSRKWLLLRGWWPCGGWWPHPEGRNDQFKSQFSSVLQTFSIQPNQSETKHDYHLDYHKRFEFLCVWISSWNRFDFKIGVLYVGQLHHYSRTRLLWDSFNFQCGLRRSAQCIS